VIAQPLIAVANSIDSTNSRSDQGTQVHTSCAMKKDKGTSRQAIATSCLMADSVESPS
jgi:hypothetical protein